MSAAIAAARSPLVHAARPECASIRAAAHAPTEPDIKEDES